MRQIRLFFVVFLILLCNGTALYALEIEIAAGATNIFFDSGRKTTLSSEKKKFKPNTFYLGHFDIHGNYSEMLGYKFRYESDNILKNQLTGSATIDLQYMYMEFGMVMGVYNTGEQPMNAGLHGLLQLSYPGIIFTSFMGSTTIGSQNGYPGDNTQTAAAMKLGFWLPNIICTFSADVRSFTKQVDKNLLTRDELFRYQFSADVFSKNVPYTIRVDMGYQELRRLYQTGGNTKTDTLKALYIGFEGKWRLGVPLSFIAGLEMPVYTWADEKMKSPDRDLILYRCMAGFSWTILPHR